MTLQKQSELLWVVVKVESGIPVMVEVYRDKQSAEDLVQDTFLNVFR